jgi:hypothetical protein
MKENVEYNQMVVPFVTLRFLITEEFPGAL